MRGDLNPGFKNNPNIISIRSFGSALQIVTDRVISEGDARTIVKAPTERDAGLATPGDKFTESVG